MALSWENLTDRERQMCELSMHEAGHAVAGVLLGGALRAATVTGGFASGGFTGRTTFDPLPLGHEPEVAYAGPWCAARWRANRRPTQAELYAVIAQGHDSDGAVLLAAGGTAAGARVVPLVERCWPAVCQVAGKLAADTVARHADVCAALGVPLTDNGHELALIRAGSAPGSFKVTRPSVPA